MHRPTPAVAHPPGTVAAGRPRARDPHPHLDAPARSTLGERLADRVARFGGSWTFILLFGAGLLIWALVNTGLMGMAAFDPYPFIFLNLLLSMLAAMQAPVIMMSQNRQAAKDRQMAAYDYQVNLRAETEIVALHDKLDALRADQIMTLLAQQQAQIALLTRLLEASPGHRTAPD